VLLSFVRAGVGELWPLGGRRDDSVLRNVSESDLPTLFEHQRDPEAAAMAAFPSRDWDAFVTHWRNNVLANPTAVNRAIVVEGELAGYVASWKSEGTLLVGYWIGRAFWGRGIASSALEEFLGAHEPRRPLRAFVAVTNTRSMRVLEKCGFRRCGESAAESDGGEEILFLLDGAA
jgi:RimJ/RimL family protein N-acetyltransferase